MSNTEEIFNMDFFEIFMRNMKENRITWAAVSRALRSSKKATFDAIVQLLSK